MSWTHIIFWAFSILWAFHILQRILYTIYFWQLKEYRWHRVAGDFIRSIRVFLPKPAIALIVLLLCRLIFSPFYYFFDNLILAVIIIWGIYSAFLLFNKKWKLPKFTKKASLIVALSVLFFVALSYLLAKEFLMFAVLFEIFLPLITFLVAAATNIPSGFIKNTIYKKASEKIKKRKNLITIAICGSYGKTSTKEFLYAFLSDKYKVFKTDGNINTEIGVAKAIIKDLSDDYEIFIAEMGAYRKGEIKLLCNIAQPQIGVLTGVNEQHLALFGSMENLLSAEGGGELSESLLEQKGTLIVNGDNKYCLNLYKKFNGNKKISATEKTKINADIWSEKPTILKDSISFLAVNKSGEMAHFGIKTLGEHNIQNILSAALAAQEVGMSLSDISEAGRKITAEHSSMLLKSGQHGIDIIDSSYSSNPNGVLADIDYLSIFSQKKIIVMPCLIELGEKSSEVHEKIGKKIGQVCDLAIITTKDKFKEIKTGAMSEGMQEKNIMFLDNPQEIYSAITLFARRGDAVLLEGRVPQKVIQLLTKKVA